MCIDGEGRIHGPVLVTDAEGALAARGLWTHGMQHGGWETFFPGGALRSRHVFLNGVLHGESAWWFESGVKKRLATFSGGLKHGPVTYWDASGRRTLSGEFREGRADGHWVSYDPAENTMAVRTFEEGVPVEGDLVKGLRCHSWLQHSEPVRSHLTSRFLITIVSVLNRPGPLEEGFPLSVGLGRCLVDSADALRVFVNESCPSRPDAHPFADEQATALAREISTSCLAGASDPSGSRAQDSAR